MRKLAMAMVLLLVPALAAAQQPGKVYRVGMLSTSQNVSDSGEIGAGFIRGLAQHGYSVGGNLVLERRAAQTDEERLPALMRELVALPVDVVVTFGYPAALAAKQAKANVAIVSFGAGDPVGGGLVDSLARPGGHLTGISDVSAELSLKRLQLLQEVAPHIRRVAMLWNAGDRGMTLRYEAMAAAAPRLGIAVQPLGVREPEDFETAFAAMDREPPDAIMMVTDSLTRLNRRRVFDYAAAHKLPAIYEIGFLAQDGGLMSYGPDLGKSFERVAHLVDRILKGANPADLPIEQPTAFELVINLRTAKALGIEVPPLLLARADRVIE